MTNTYLAYHDHFVQPGYLAMSDDPAVFSSVCGCGVVLTLWDRMNRSGGIVHCLYAKEKQGTVHGNYCAATAIPALVRMVGCSPQRITAYEAQLFGGGYHDRQVQKHADGVVRVVKSELKRHKIRVTSEDLGGVLGRKVMFNTNSGEVVVLKTPKVRQTDWYPELNVKRVMSARERGE